MVWPELYQEWKAQWCCSQCGHIFKHDIHKEMVAGKVSVLPSLELMWRRGALTDMEWAKAKQLILKAPEMRETLGEKIAELYRLRLSGALSESEFNMKKWDVLSRK